MTTGGSDYLRGGAGSRLDARRCGQRPHERRQRRGLPVRRRRRRRHVGRQGSASARTRPTPSATATAASTTSTVDYLFGGNGLKTDPVTGGADILDYRPRPGVDPAAWFEATDTRATDPVAAHQHHQGIDWIYGGWDRDVMQANIADNGPNQGDKLMDWTGAYNLYTHCPSAYGGYNDVRLFSPSLQTFLQQLAFSLGAGKSLRGPPDEGHLWLQRAGARLQRRREVEFRLRVPGHARPLRQLLVRAKVTPHAESMNVAGSDWRPRSFPRRRSRRPVGARSPRGVRYRAPASIWMSDRRHASLRQQMRALQAGTGPGAGPVVPSRA